MLESIQTTLVSILKGEKVLINEKTLINSAFALSFLSVYLPN